jgi:hypothetical protein
MGRGPVETRTADTTPDATTNLLLNPASPMSIYGSGAHHETCAPSHGHSHSHSHDSGSSSSYSGGSDSGSSSGSDGSSDGGSSSGGCD